MLRHRGWQVVPAVAWGRKGLISAVSGRRYHERLVDDETFASWFGPNGAHRDANSLGIFTGTVSRCLHVYEIELQNPTAMAWWEYVSHRLDLDPRRNLTVITNGYLRTFIHMDLSKHGFRGEVAPGITVYGDGDFITVPVRTTQDAMHEEGVH